MTQLLFDGEKHELSVMDDNGNLISTWSAYNNIDSRIPMRHIPNGTYPIEDRNSPHYHTPDAESPYGLYGIIRFSVPGHSGIGVHFGRAHYRNNPGPQHVTNGCIRTTDDAMFQIKNIMRLSPLNTIEVRNNSGAAAASSTQRNENIIYQGAKMQFL
ncbi:L,D-transpeptidase [Atlantibacter sp.]|uniref:L,D-transpeptidase n=1 Tax=Atlantibacter sp. TaxID=1903473 RepID=UPI0028A062C8|nr:L,D-transpeptidase [Atlantibacter sp.]